MQNEAPDIVILDVMLPGKNGLDVLKNLRLVLPVPVIMLTTKGEDADRIVGLEIEADDDLPKPCTPRELVARIRTVLRRRAPEDRLDTDANESLTIQAGGVVM